MATLRKYETTWILVPDVSDEDKTKVADRIHKLITEAGGELLRTDEWGRRKLSYEIKHFQHGVYVYNRFTAPADLIAEIERVLRLLDPVIKFLTVKLEDDAERDIRPDEGTAPAFSSGEEDGDDDDDDDED